MRGSTRWVRRGCACVGLLVFGLLAQRQELTAQQTVAVPPPPRVLVWLSGGGGFGSGGTAGVVNGLVAVKGWSAGWKYMKTMSGSSSEGNESYTEHHAVMVGRVTGAEGRRSVAAGLGMSKHFDQPYSPCSDCWFGDSQKGNEQSTGFGPSLALAAEARTRPLGGAFALGVEATAFIGMAPAVAVGVSIVMGKLR